MICDKCGKTVRYRDDARCIAALATGNPTHLQAPPRHIQCSPSRAQYIPLLGIADPRPETNKERFPSNTVAVTEERWTQAYLFHVYPSAPLA